MNPEWGTEGKRNSLMTMQLPSDSYWNFLVSHKGRASVVATCFVLVMESVKERAGAGCPEGAQPHQVARAGMWPETLQTALA